MKYSEIPQLTSVGSYQINICLSEVVDTVNSWTEKHGLELNPDFQRGHVWNEEQQIAFVEFMLRGGKSAKVIYFNHPGWMDDWKGNRNMVCVDGLQRLTACMRFINNEIPVFGHYYKEFEGWMPLDIDLLFNVNNLKTKAEVLIWYIEFNTGGTVHTEEEINRVKELLDNETKIIE